MLKLALCLTNLIISYTLFQPTYGTSSEYKVGESLGSSFNLVKLNELSSENETFSAYDNQTSNAQKAVIIILDRVTIHNLPMPNQF